MRTREKLEDAELHLEVQVFAEEHLLVDHASEDRVTVCGRFLVGEVNVLRPDRYAHRGALSQRIVTLGLELAHGGPHPQVTAASGFSPQHDAVEEISAADEVR